MRKLTAALVLTAMLASVGVAIAQSDGHEGHGYVPPPVGVRPAELSLVDAAGRPFTTANLQGRWTLVYFGYSRCRTACPIALPAIRDAAAALRAQGREAQAVFVDIDAAPQPLRLRSANQDGHQGHAHAGHAGDDMAALAREFPSVMFLTGRRGQVRGALEAFRVRTEHVPPRTQLGEQGHSINHTTLIYVMDPTGALAGYAYHDTSVEALAAIATR